MGAGVELWAWDGTIWRKVLIDAGGRLQVDIVAAPAIDAHIHGYDGAAWQMLRTQNLATYVPWNQQTLIVNACASLFDYAIGGYISAKAAVYTNRMVAVGQVVAGTRYLHWVKCNPGAGNSLWELSDDLNGLSATVLDEFHTAREGHTDNFIPAMKFANGIYLKTFTNMTSITFGFTPL